MADELAEESLVWAVGAKIPKSPGMGVSRGSRFACTLYFGIELGSILIIIIISYFILLFFGSLYRLNCSIGIWIYARWLVFNGQGTCIV